MLRRKLYIYHKTPLILTEISNNIIFILTEILNKQTNKKKTHTHTHTHK